MQRLLPFFALTIAILMVSRIPYPHPLSQLVRGQSSFAHLVGIVFAVMALLIVRGYAVPLLCVLFVLGPPMKFAWDVIRHRRTSKEPLF
jgi:phosphatidylserine synthase